MKRWLLVLGVSCRCCGLLELKFHSEVVLSVSLVIISIKEIVFQKGKGLAGVYQCVLRSALALSFAVTVSSSLTWEPPACCMLWCSRDGGRRRSRVRKFRSRVRSVQWQWFSLPQPQPEHSQPRPKCLRVLCPEFSGGDDGLVSIRVCPTPDRFTPSGVYCSPRTPNYEALHFHRLSSAFLSAAQVVPAKNHRELRMQSLTKETLFIPIWILTE